MPILRYARTLLATLALMPLAAFAPIQMSARPRQLVSPTTAGRLMRKRQPRWLLLLARMGFVLRWDD